MIRRFITIVLAGLLLSSCGSKSGKQAASADENAVKVEFASLIENPADYVGKDIVVEGKVVHVCMHTGKKMFIVGENPDLRLFISAGENAPKFPLELVGSSVSVEGRLERVVTAAKPAPEKLAAGLEVAAAASDTSSKEGNTEDCATESAVAKQSALADLMMIYNKHVVVK